MKLFPCWLYHRSMSPRVVETQAELEELGADWARHPDLLPADDATNAPETPVAAPAAEEIKTPKKRTK